MAKPEWGQKRACPGCGSRFYDLLHDPITCPGCGATVDPTAFSRTRRSRTVAAKPAAKPAVAAEVVKVATVDVAADGDDAIEVAVVGDDEDDDNVIEDVSELGEDEDDVSEVVEGVEEKGADDR